jgi:hypothetical protein
MSGHHVTLDVLLSSIPELPGATCTQVAGFTEADPADCVEVCNHCPALAACRAWTLTLTGGARPHDLVQGGLHFDSHGRITRVTPGIKAPLKPGQRGPRLSTHCRNGHEYTPENTAYQRKGTGNVTRSCKACKAEQNKRKYAKLAARAKESGRTPKEQRLAEGGTPIKLSDACKNGHQFTATNTEHDSRGRRICLACRAMRRERWVA